MSLSLGRNGVLFQGGGRGGPHQKKSGPTALRFLWSLDLTSMGPLSLKTLAQMLVKTAHHIQGVFFSKLKLESVRLHRKSHQYIVRQKILYRLFNIWRDGINVYPLCLGNLQCQNSLEASIHAPRKSRDIDASLWSCSC